MINVSIIIPVYNTKDYLLRCIDSVVGQTLQPHEILLIDDGSLDGSSILCDELRSRWPNLIKVFHQKNSGVSLSRNVGIENATGDYIYFLDSDDWIELSTLEQLVQAATIEQTDLTIGSVYNVDVHGNANMIVESMPINIAQSPETNPEILFIMPSICNRLISKKVIDQNHLRFSQIAIGEDFEFLMKLLTSTRRCIFLDKPRYNYFHRSNSAMHSSKSEKNRDIVIAFDSVIHHYEDLGLMTQYKPELEYLAIRHVFLDASVRVLKIDPKNEILREFHSWMKLNFSVFKKNKYLYRFNFKEKLVIQLLDLKLYGLVYSLFRLSNRR
jgi:CDP-glycerol glycerophosphotransferase